MNYLLAVLIIMSMFGVYGQNCFRVNKLVSNDSGYLVSSLQENDVILKVNNKKIYLTTDFMDQIKDKKAGDAISLLVRRNDQDISVSVNLLEDTNFSNIEDTNTLLKALGISEMQSVGVKFGFFETIGNSFQYSGRLATTIFTVIRELFTGQLGIKSMGGTVTTITVTTVAIKNGGFRYLLYISSFIGVNLAVFNLLPFPALDGSRVIFCLIEWIRKKPLNKRVEGLIHTVGLVILMLFAVFIDLQQCF